MNSKTIAHLKKAPVSLEERRDDFDKVAEIWLTGSKSAKVIAKQLSLTPAYAEDLITELRHRMQNDEEIRFRAREAVLEFDTQFDRVLTKMHQLSDDAEAEGDLKTRATVLKNIADTTARRVEVMQKSGLLANMDLADQMAEQEAQIEAISTMIKDIVKSYPELKGEVARRLGEILGRAEAV